MVETGKHKHGTRHNKDHIGKVGMRIDAPYLESGLLPPYLFRAIEKLFPKRSFRREKAASLGVAMVFRQTDFDFRRDRNSGRHQSLSLSDKVYLGPVSILQNLETGKTHMENVDWRQSLYRFELGWRDRISIGTEAQLFEDRRSRYAALSHLRTLIWRWPDKRARVKLMVGTKRETSFAQSNIGVIELEWRF